MMRWFAVLVGGMLLVGCADPREPLVPSKYEDLTPAVAKKVATKEFGAGLEALESHDAANDWTTTSCEATANTFLVAGELFKRVDQDAVKQHAAVYNAALAYQRCGLNDPATATLTTLLEVAPSHHRARAQLALLRFATSGDIDAVIEQLERAIQDGEYHDADGLVSLATFQMKRATRDDLDGAKLNLQRALAIDDGHMAALNQLAIFYLVQAGGGGDALQLAAANPTGDPASHATLELAALICSQAQRKNANYAPIYNTAGLVAAHLGDLSAAAASFARARELDGSFFEAHMNYAAVNMQFRGFTQAEGAYAKALAVRPKSYDAMLGLSLALRGQATDHSGSDKIARAEALLHQAQSLDGARPEAYFNEAILVQEYRSRGLAPEQAKVVLLGAKKLFATFLERAKGKPSLSEARARAEERMKDIDQMIVFL